MYKFIVIGLFFILFTSCNNVTRVENESSTTDKRYRNRQGKEAIEIDTFVSYDPVHYNENIEVFRKYFLENMQIEKKDTIVDGNKTFITTYTRINGELIIYSENESVQF